MPNDERWQSDECPRAYACVPYVCVPAGVYGRASVRAWCFRHETTRWLILTKIYHSIITDEDKTA